MVFAFTPYRARFRNAEGKVVETAFEERRGLKGLIPAGYVVAVADIRGKGASFGHRRGFQDRTEAQDGYDLIEWLARQPYATGKVGMIGCSYLGGTTFQTATTAPPSLKAVFVGATELDKYGFVRRGGITAQFNTRPDEPLSDDLMSLPVDADGDGALLREAVAMHGANTPMAGLWYGMPFRDSVSTYTGNRFWDEVAVWRYLAAIRKAGIATYFWSNWQDEPTAQVILAAANLGGKFLAGPGGHCIPPPDYDFQREIVRWFDYHLKGIDNGIMREPRATYHVMGEGWVRSNTLPGASGGRVTLVPRRRAQRHRALGQRRAAAASTGKPAERPLHGRLHPAARRLLRLLGPADGRQGAELHHRAAGRAAAAGRLSGCAADSQRRQARRPCLRLPRSGGAGRQGGGHLLRAAGAVAPQDRQATLRHARACRGIRAMPAMSRRCRRGRAPGLIST